jgi:hypothetical protein
MSKAKGVEEHAQTHKNAPEDGLDIQPPTSLHLNKMNEVDSNIAQKIEKRIY